MVKYSLDSTFASLSDPTRRDMLQRLMGGEHSVSELAEAYNMSLPAVSKHLKVLEAAKLIVKDRRGRQQIVRLAPATFRDATDHLLYYETVLNSRLDSLEHYLQKGGKVATSKVAQKTKPAKKKLIMTHTFDAPRQRVWGAYTDPTQVTNWWGPEGATMISCENDVRVGGAWRFVVRGADDQNYVVSGLYQDVQTPERLVYTDGFGEPHDIRPEALVTVTLEELPGGKTKLTKTSLASPAVHQLHAAWLKAIEGA